jgi:hypothetical protein
MVILRFSEYCDLALYCARATHEVVNYA